MFSTNKLIRESVNQRLKAPKSYSGAVNRRRTDNTMDKCENGQSVICKPLFIKLNIDQQELTKILD